MQHVFGYGVGIDMTRRDLQDVAKKLARPWEVAKAFEHSAPCTALVPAENVKDPSKGAIWLEVNGQRKQTGDLSQMIWDIPNQIAFLSTLFELKPGDLIFTGTPAGVGAIKKGDVMRAHVDGVGELEVAVV
jgi:fumarylpyruvate hydrolase